MSDHLVRKSGLYKMLSKICTVVSDDCLLHQTACNTKYTGKLVFTHCMAIVVIQFQIQIRLNRALHKSIFVN